MVAIFAFDTPFPAIVLALFFAWHVFWPAGWGGSFDGVSAAIALAAAVALWRFKLGVLPLLGACAVAGLAVQLIR